MSLQKNELIEAIAADLGVSESFVEKDWHAMRLVAVLANVKYDNFIPVFSGGTSLSKGYGMIKRFSEDLDFKIHHSSGIETRGKRRKYREHIVQAIQNAGTDWTLEKVNSSNESRYFNCKIKYKNIFEPAVALRPHLKLEMTFGTPALSFEYRSMRSFVSIAMKSSPEFEKIACVSPVETAADKLSALTWRILSRKRGGEEDDPTVIRHLHDLVALETFLSDSDKFVPLLLTLLKKDISRWKPDERILKMKPVEQIQEALAILNKDKEYASEYERFVTNMSFARNDEIPTFRDALTVAVRIMKQIDRC